MFKTDCRITFDTDNMGSVRGIMTVLKLKQKSIEREPNHQFSICTRVNKKQRSELTRMFDKYNVNGTILTY